MVVSEKKSFKVEIDGEVLAAIRDTFDRKKIGYWDGAEAVFRWFSVQDGMLQSLILGQVDAEYRADIAKMILTKMAGVKSVRTRPFPEIPYPPTGDAAPEKPDDRPSGRRKRNDPRPPKD